MAFGFDWRFYAARTGQAAFLDEIAPIVRAADSLEEVRGAVYLYLESLPEGQRPKPKFLRLQDTRRQRKVAPANPSLIRTVQTLPGRDAYTAKE